MDIKQTGRNRGGGTAVLGGLLVVAGILFLLKLFKVIQFNFHIWPFFLIGIGIMSGIKHGFRKPGAFILIAIGAAYMIPEFKIFGQPSSHLIWPLALIVLGVFIVLRPKKSCAPGFPRGGDFMKYGRGRENKEQLAAIEALFGGRKEIITSRQFRGANITAVCGGAEINLMQADSEEQPVIIDLRIIFGGVELIVPAHWEVINEVDVLFGGIEDKRQLRMQVDKSTARALLLRGNVTFGGLEIKSY